jgi:hypothetical protein
MGIHRLLTNYSRTNLRGQQKFGPGFAFLGFAALSPAGGGNDQRRQFLDRR